MSDSDIAPSVAQISGREVRYVVEEVYNAVPMRMLGILGRKLGYFSAFQLGVAVVNNHVYRVCPVPPGCRFIC